jgi:hypothetical protein
MSSGNREVKWGEWAAVTLRGRFNPQRTLSQDWPRSGPSLEGTLSEGPAAGGPARLHGGLRSARGPYHIHIRAAGPGAQRARHVLVTSGSNQPLAGQYRSTVLKGYRDRHWPG